MITVDIYYNTGFDIINIPCNPELLNNGEFSKRTFTDLNLVQTDWLAEITLELPEDEINWHRDADYVVITDDDKHTRTCYTVDHYEMVSDNVCKFYLILDPYNTAGGMEPVAGHEPMIVLSGSANRLSVPLLANDPISNRKIFQQAEDNTFFTLDEPFEATGRLHMHYDQVPYTPYVPTPPGPTPTGPSGKLMLPKICDYFVNKNYTYTTYTEPESEWTYSAPSYDNQIKIKNEDYIPTSEQTLIGRTIGMTVGMGNYFTNADGLNRALACVMSSSQCQQLYSDLTMATKAYTNYTLRQILPIIASHSKCLVVDTRSAETFDNSTLYNKLSAIVEDFIRDCDEIWDNYSNSRAEGKCKSISVYYHIDSAEIVDGVLQGITITKTVQGPLWGSGTYNGVHNGEVKTY